MNLHIQRAADQTVSIRPCSGPNITVAI